MALYDTAGQIINDAASECGLTPASDPFASTDPAFIQMRNILTQAGRELLGLHQWQKFIRYYEFNTDNPLIPGGNDYAMPEDFGSMIDQTNWNPNSMFPLGGPLSPQDWAFLTNTNLASSTIYVSFRLAEGVISLLPDPPPANNLINFQYKSRNWASATGSTDPTLNRITASEQIPLFEPILIEKFLKLRYLEAKGFDTTAALGQFNSVFMQWSGKDTSMPVLTLARTRLFPYLDYRNVPETNYGLP